MKLMELIKYLKNFDETEKLAKREIPNVEVGLIELYMVETLNINSEIKFFDSEKIPSNIEI